MTLHLAIFWFVVHFYCKTRATIYKFCPFLTLPCNAFLGLLGREKIPYKYNSYPNPNLLNSAMEECPRWKFFRGETAVKGQFLSVEFLQLQANTSASSRLSPRRRRFAQICAESSGDHGTLSLAGRLVLLAGAWGLSEMVVRLKQRFTNRLCTKLIWYHLSFMLVFKTR